MKRISALHRNSLFALAVALMGLQQSRAARADDYTTDPRNLDYANIYNTYTSGQRADIARMICHSPDLRSTLEDVVVSCNKLWPSKLKVPSYSDKAKNDPNTVVDLHALDGAILEKFYVAAYTYYCKSTPAKDRPNSHCDHLNTENRHADFMNVSRRQEELRTESVEQAKKDLKKLEPGSKDFGHYKSLSNSRKRHVLKQRIKTYDAAVQCFQQPNLSQECKKHQEEILGAQQELFQRLSSDKDKNPQRRSYLDEDLKSKLSSRVTQWKQFKSDQAENLEAGSNESNDSEADNDSAIDEDEEYSASEDEEDNDSDSEDNSDKNDDENSDSEDDQEDDDYSQHSQSVSSLLPDEATLKAANRQQKKQLELVRFQMMQLKKFKSNARSPNPDSEGNPKNSHYKQRKVLEEKIYENLSELSVANHRTPEIAALTHRYSAQMAFHAVEHLLNNKSDRNLITKIMDRLDPYSDTHICHDEKSISDLSKGIDLLKNSFNELQRPTSNNKLKSILNFHPQGTIAPNRAEAENLDYDQVIESIQFAADALGSVLKAGCRNPGDSPSHVQLKDRLVIEAELVRGEIRLNKLLHAKHLGEDIDSDESDELQRIGTELKSLPNKTAIQKLRMEDLIDFSGLTTGPTNWLEYQFNTANVNFNAIRAKSQSVEVTKKLDQLQYDMTYGTLLKCQLPPVSFRNTIDDLLQTFEKVVDGSPDQLLRNKKDLLGILTGVRFIRCPNDLRGITPIHSSTARLIEPKGAPYSSLTEDAILQQFGVDAFRGEKNFIRTPDRNQPLKSLKDAIIDFYHSLDPKAEIEPSPVPKFSKALLNQLTMAFQSDPNLSRFDYSNTSLQLNPSLPRGHDPRARSAACALLWASTQTTDVPFFKKLQDQGKLIDPKTGKKFALDAVDYSRTVYLDAVNKKVVMYTSPIFLHSGDNDPQRYKFDFVPVVAVTTIDLSIPGGHNKIQTKVFPLSSSKTRLKEMRKYIPEN